eukprot:3452425-Amphidinium_carterae.1
MKVERNHARPVESRRGCSGGSLPQVEFPIIPVQLDKFLCRRHGRSERIMTSPGARLPEVTSVGRGGGGHSSSCCAFCKVAAATELKVLKGAVLGSYHRWCHHGQRNTRRLGEQGHPLLVAMGPRSIATAVKAIAQARKENAVMLHAPTQVPHHHTLNTEALLLFDSFPSLAGRAGANSLSCVRGIFSQLFVSEQWSMDQAAWDMLELVARLHGANVFRPRSTDHSLTATAWSIGEPN